jgi:hypothetical protein
MGNQSSNEKRKKVNSVVTIQEAPPPRRDLPEPMAKKRREILNEILETEKRYVATLENCVKVN